MHVPQRFQWFEERCSELNFNPDIFGIGVRYSGFGAPLLDRVTDLRHHSCAGESFKNVLTRLDPILYCATSNRIRVSEVLFGFRCRS